MLLSIFSFILPNKAEAWSRKGRWVKIKKDKHNSNWYLPAQGLLFKNKVTMLVRFDESAIYENTDPSNQGDINKLWGFSDCSSGHHKNSARFGFNWYQGKLRLWGYTYSQGNRSWVELQTLNLNETYKTEIYLKDNEYVFMINDIIVGTQPRGCSGNGGIKYRLGPYFGGDERSPHDMAIYLKRI